MENKRVPPSSVDFSRLLPLGVKAVSKSRKFAPNNGASFSATNNVIRIPLNTNSFIDPRQSYLTFDIKVTGSEAGATKYTACDGSAHALISQLRIEGSEGTELERCSNYNVVYHAMRDLQCGDDHRMTLQNCMELAPTGGDLQSVKLVDNATQNVRGVSLKLMSGLLNSDKYIPAGFVSGGGLVIELTLETDKNALFTNGTGTPTYELSNVNYIAQCVEMSEDFNQNFRAMLKEQGGIQWSGQNFYTHSYNFSSSTSGTANVPVTGRYKSLKAMFHVLRQSENLNKSTEYSVSRRSSNNAESIQWHIGANVYPSQPVQGTATNPSQFVAELVKAVSSLGDVRMGSQLNIANFTEVATVVATVVNGKAVYGIDLESYAHSSDILESGINTADLALNMNVEFKFGASALNAKDVTVTSACLVDSIYTLDSQGILTVTV